MIIKLPSYVGFIGSRVRPWFCAGCRHHGQGGITHEHCAPCCSEDEGGAACGQGQLQHRVAHDKQVGVASSLAQLFVGDSVVKLCESQYMCNKLAFECMPAAIGSDHATQHHCLAMTGSGTGQQLSEILPVCCLWLQVPPLPRMWARCMPNMWRLGREVASCEATQALNRAC